ncbi:hypothetical protein [Enterococcus malodoratus]|uniref:hypothetical protein n=1 Tax=Enterococcus malodoratus TaxID=71451 RepID=UPI00054EBA5D|nr:hypothetical protein [Enterococcus malodoratus]
MKAQVLVPQLVQVKEVSQQVTVAVHLRVRATVQVKAHRLVIQDQTAQVLATVIVQVYRQATAAVLQLV